MTVVGFDFGTTNSLVSSVSGGKPFNLLDEDGLPFPSVVCYEGTRKILGREAKQRLDSAGIGIHGNIIRSPKFFLGQDSLFVNGVERSPVDVVADVVAFVKQAALESRVDIDLAGISRAAVTIPIDMEGRRRAALRDAFRRAGIGVVQFIHEPFAALYGHFRGQADVAASLRQYENKHILVVDWGGGTLDLTLCTLRDGRVTQLHNHGTDAVGGDVLDDSIRNEVIRRFCAEAEVPPGAEPHPDARTRLLHQCEQAKIALSSRQSFPVYVPTFFHEDTDLDYSLHRDTLEQIADPFVRDGIRRISHVLDQSGVAPTQVAMCLATGGMVNMPAIRARLHELFGPQRVKVKEESGTLVAEGAAWFGHDRRPLHLAKNVELQLARGSYMPLLRAGTKMPMQNEVQRHPFHLYCADPRDGHAKFEFCSPERPGDTVLATDPRVPLAHLVVKADAKAPPLKERLELDVQIDDNLILRASARSLNQQDHAAVEIHDLEFGVWFPQVGRGSEPSAENMPLEQQRRTMQRPGDLVVRANVAKEPDPALVPGELLYEHNRLYFDRRRNPPQEQVDELLYYAPCAVCGRASNDPECRCLSRRST